MKQIAPCSLCLLLFSCVNVPPHTMTVGRDINSGLVQAIQKGTTTSQQIEGWFGSPDMKSAVSATEEKWVYHYTQVTSTATGSVFNMEVKGTGIKKMLDLLIKDGIVLNYTYTEGPNDVTYGARNQPQNASPSNDTPH